MIESARKTCSEQDMRSKPLPSVHPHGKKDSFPSELHDKGRYSLLTANQRHGNGLKKLVRAWKRASDCHKCWAD